MTSQQSKDLTQVAQDFIEAFNSGDWTRFKATPDRRDCRWASDRGGRNRVERHWLNTVKVVNTRPLGAFTELAYVDFRRHDACIATCYQVVQAGTFKVSVPRSL